ncbi:MAG: acyl-CoA thioesterase domain-containing protein [Acidimicrobiia bacterium]
MTLADILSVEAVGDDHWRAWTPPGSMRPDIYGGQVAGQALLAASQTVDPAYLANSVHCSFLRRGRPTLPLDIHVERTRAGRTYSNRRIEVRQDDNVIFAMLASFHVDEPGREFDHPMPSGVPDPDDLPAPAEARLWDPALEMRSPPVASPMIQWWARVTGEFPADPTMHLAAALYASDLRAGSAAMNAVGIPAFGEAELGDDRPTSGNFGSLDHALWFHRIPKVDEWFFCDVRPLTVRDSRGLVLGTMFDRGGNHIATFTQEMFLKIDEST